MSDFDFIVGFDFGHGETSVAVVDTSKVSISDGTIPVQDLYICEHSREPKITSLVGYNQDKTDVDIEIYDFKFFDSIEAYFKGPVISSSDYAAISDQDKKHFKDFICCVFQKVLSNPKNVRLVGAKVKFYAACPSGWTDKQRSAYLQFLKSECQLPIEAVIEESRAAHVMARKKLFDRNPNLYTKAKRLVVLDLGSSTLDITLHADKTYTDGYLIGAGQIEEKLLSHFIAEDIDFASKFNAYCNSCSTARREVLLFLRYAKEEYFNKQAKYSEKEVTFSCQIDWDELSQDEVPGNSKLRLKGSDFIRMLKESSQSQDSYESHLKDCINDFIAKYGGADAVILTGGASQMSFYKDIVLKCFNLPEEACIKDETPSYSISQGVATIGYMDSKCPIFDDDTSIPDELQKLSNNLPQIFNAEILLQYKQSYTNNLCSAVSRWKNQEGKKTLRDLYSDIAGLIDEWDKNSEAISRSINESVGKQIHIKVNTTLRDIIRLYFGFDAKIPEFEINYDLGFAVPDRDNKALLKKLLLKMKEHVNSISFFSRWNDETSLDKDRSDDSKFVEKLSADYNETIAKWFARYSLDDELQHEVSDCRVRLVSFYRSVIRNITCQI